MARSTKGRESRRNTAVARARTPDLSRFYRHHLPAIAPGDFEFRLDLLRPKSPPLSLDTMVDTFNWVDEQAVLTGSLTAWRPDPQDPLSCPIARGHLIRCRVRWDGGTYQLWTMRCDAPSIQSEAGQVQVTLQDDMALVDGSALDWFFRVTKRRPHGYFCHEIAIEVCRRLGLKPGNIAQGTKRITLSKRGASGLDVLRAAYGQEKQHAGRSFVIRIRNGRLDVVPLQRNPLLYVLEGQIQTALITQKAGRKVPTTVLTGRGHVGVGKAAKKVSYTAFDRRVVRRYGHVPQVKNYGRVHSHAALRALVKRDYAAALRTTDTITIQHQGIPFIQRGDGVQVLLPWEGYKGSSSYVYATRANHTVQSGVYTTEWDFTATDPYLAQVQADAKAAAARAKKHRVRKRKNLHA